MQRTSHVETSLDINSKGAYTETKASVNKLLTWLGGSSVVVRILGVWHNGGEGTLPTRALQPGRWEAVEVGQRRGRDGAWAGEIVRVFPHI